MALEALGFLDSPLIRTDRATNLVASYTQIDNLLGWRPEPIARSKLGSGGVPPRMVVSLAASAALALAAAAYLFLQSRSSGGSALLSEAGSSLATALAKLEPAVESDQPLAEATGSILALESSARALFDIAAQLPADQRRAAVDASTAALRLQTSLRTAWAYEGTIEPLWLPPPLSADADPLQMAEELATWESELTSMVVSLPSSPALDPHSNEVQKFMAWLGSWRVGYLDHLADGDKPGAERSLAELESRLAELRTGFEATMAEVREAAKDQVDTAVSALAALTP